MFLLFRLEGYIPQAVLFISATEYKYLIILEGVQCCLCEECDTTVITNLSDR